MRLHEIVEISRRVSKTSGRSNKVRHLAAFLQRAEADAIETAVPLLLGRPRQGRIGIGWATMQAAVPRTAARTPALMLVEVDAALDRIARTSGAGSPKERARLMGELLARATREEQDFLLRAVLGELRQGALEGLMVEAVALAAELSVAEIRRALMVQGDLTAVARVALTEGRPGLGRLAIQLFRPVKPMLAQTAQDTADALARLGPMALEYKLDGARIQIHKLERQVSVFTRSLNEVTAAVPEIVEAVRDLPVRSIILDGEALAFRRNGMPEPFQVTMRRFGRKLEVERMRDSVPLRPFFFDCLYFEGKAIIDQPGDERFAALAGALAVPIYGYVYDVKNGRCQRRPGPGNRRNPETPCANATCCACAAGVSLTLSDNSNGNLLLVGHGLYVFYSVGTS